MPLIDERFSIRELKGASAAFASVLSAFPVTVINSKGEEILRSRLQAFRMRSLHTLLSLLVSALLCLSGTMLEAAPLPEFSGDQDFQQFLQKDLEYICKIKGDVAQLQQLVCTTFQLCSEEELMLVKQKLGIFQVPLDQCHSKSFQLDACFSQIRDGLQIYHGHLSLLLQLLPTHTSTVDNLRLDVSNLSTNIQQQMEDRELNTVTYPKTEDLGTLPSLLSDFDKQAGSFIILTNFQRFLEMALRALRHLTQQ